MDFSSTLRYGYRKGDFFLGTSPLLRRRIGVKTERHAITIAGARSGKGVATIIPNLKRWPHNVLVIDPKGENASVAAKDRAAMGQAVHVIDPFKRAKVDSHFQAQFNPLDVLDISSPTLAEDINVIADGMVMRGLDPGAENWDDGARTLIAWLIAAVFLDVDNKNLLTVRDILNDTKLLQELAEDYEHDGRLGGLLSAGAARVLAKEGHYYISNAQKHTEWISSDVMRDCLSSSSFKLSDIKNGKISIFLVLPATYLVTHGRLLRLFVQCAIAEMERPTPGGCEKGEQCLFFLDEFFSLGYMKEVAVSSSLMPGFGLHLWPILQDLGQLVKLYGREGAETFFANADVHQFFGNTDPMTLDAIAKMIGTRHEAGLFQSDSELVNKPLMSPQEVRAHVAKDPGDKVARRMIVFTQGNRILSLRLLPYFRKWWHYLAFWKL